MIISDTLLLPTYLPTIQCHPAVGADLGPVLGDREERSRRRPWNSSGTAQHSVIGVEVVTHLKLLA